MRNMNTCMITKITTVKKYTMKTEHWKWMGEKDIRIMILDIRIMEFESNCKFSEGLPLKITWKPQLAYNIGARTSVEARYLCYYISFVSLNLFFPFIISFY